MSEPAVSRPSPPAGCLTDAEIAAVQAAEPGQAPEALARHLATCGRCQQRALFGGERRVARRRKTPELPSVGRALFFLALVLAAMLAFFYTLQKLAGRIE